MVAQERTEAAEQCLVGIADLVVRPAGSVLLYTHPLGSGMGVAIYDPVDDKVRLCEGVYEGRIATEPRGQNGFGYDPIFFSTQLQKTSAEMTMEEKNAVSHRGMAIRKAREILQLEFT